MIAVFNYERGGYGNFILKVAASQKPAAARKQGREGNDVTSGFYSPVRALLKLSSSQSGFYLGFARVLQG